MKTLFSLFFFMIAFLSGCSQKKTNYHQATTTMKEPNDTAKVEKTEQEWKSLLTDEQYYVLRQKGTERPFTGKFYLHKEKGVYVCAACGNELFTSDMKFDSHCGWPSFDKEIEGGKISTQLDTTHGMIRTEIMCGKCSSHLGHLFDDGPTATGLRYCVNSVSLDFKKDKEQE
ncbi:MAG: peptide-methionine (R)-S-oxide reductase MsrB [Chitinophagales bacterium]|nr:peptide-methionine (R)-S-oxide reductase MsrB [Chitinophagales bacterium]